MAMTDREAARICGALGHHPLGIESKTPMKHRFECSCGYVTTYRATFQHAVEGGIHHMRLEAKKALKNGVSAGQLGASA
jgi:hypothetical protein